MNYYPLVKKCEVCSAEFIVNNGAEFRNTTCSTICGNKKAAKTRSGKNHWNWKNPNAPKGENHPFYGKHHSKEANEKNKLKHLGKIAWNKNKKGIFSEATITKMSLEKKGKHLSPKTEFQKGLIPWNKGKKYPQFSGENSSNWQGGITPEKNKIRGSLEYKLWQDSVKNRDYNCCQKCGENRVSKLMAHHILNFSQFPELRLAIDNGITFCRVCHKEFHKIYSRKNNTIEQIEEFLNDESNQ